MSMYISLADAAAQLGMSEDELAEARQSGKIYGYRDGGTWKFKPEEVERFASERGEGGAAASSGGDELPALDDEEDSDDGVLLSELELGESNPTTSSTVIGKADDPNMTGGSDLQIADDELTTHGSDVKLVSNTGDSGGSDIALSGDSGNDDLLLADSGINLSDDSGDDDAATMLVSRDKQPEDDEPQAGTSDLKLGGSDVDLGAEKAGASDLSLGSDLMLDSGALDLSLDDDLQLGESGVSLEDEGSGKSEDVLSETPGTSGSGSSGGSDITISPGDSGISLGPSDSGLSLEEPLELGGDDDEMLSLNEDDESTSTLGEDDFLLTPLDDTADDPSQDSGSQVIALDEESSMDDSAATMLTGGGSAPAMAAMLDEDTTPHMGTATVDAGGPAMQPAGGPAMVSAPPAREAPYTVWNVVGLVLCFLMLALTGMMMYDLLRNMWAWDQPLAYSSPIMEWVLGLFEG